MTDASLVEAVPLAILVISIVVVGVYPSILTDVFSNGLEPMVSAIEEMVGAGLRPPGLTAVLVGGDPASQIYVRNKERAANRAGLLGDVQRLAEDIALEELVRRVEALNRDDAVDGIQMLEQPDLLDYDSDGNTIGGAELLS